MIPTAPDAALELAHIRGVCQRQVTDRYDMGPDISEFGMPAAVTECVQLFSVPDLQAGLFGNP